MGINLTKDTKTVPEKCNNSRLTTKSRSAMYARKRVTVRGNAGTNAGTARKEVIIKTHNAFSDLEENGKRKKILTRGSMLKSLANRKDTTFESMTVMMKLNHCDYPRKTG